MDEYNQIKSDDPPGQTADAPNSSTHLKTMEMPMSIITRLIKDTFGDDRMNMMISTDSKHAYQQASGLFILYIFSM